mmetsp:Transcript_40603/g.95345  ORF Transcript_40603/g.95345 Transcript_40603/m.95345 type:complete len:233 (+) Transcript_40603:527-1225(+)
MLGDGKNSDARFKSFRGRFFCSEDPNSTHRTFTRAIENHSIAARQRRRTRPDRRSRRSDCRRDSRLPEGRRKRSDDRPGDRGGRPPLLRLPRGRGRRGLSLRPQSGSGRGGPRGEGRLPRSRRLPVLPDVGRLRRRRGLLAELHRTALRASGGNFDHASLPAQRRRRRPRAVRGGRGGDIAVSLSLPGGRNLRAGALSSRVRPRVHLSLGQTPLRTSAPDGLAPAHDAKVRF